MNHDPLDKEPYLRSKLDEYHVKVPDFPIKKSRWSRFIQYLASPTKDPLESIIASENGVIALKVMPAVGSAALVLAQFLFML